MVNNKKLFLHAFYSVNRYNLEITVVFVLKYFVLTHNSFLIYLFMQKWRKAHIVIIFYGSTTNKESSCASNLFVTQKAKIDLLQHYAKLPSCQFYNTANKSVSCIVCSEVF